MADIAALGLSVDSSQVEKGEASLDRLTGAARRAEGAAKSLAGGSRAASAAASAVAGSADAASAALNSEAAAAAKAANAMRVHGKAVNDNARRMGGSMSGLAAQFQDIGVTAAMGMNPAIIALQQGTQIAGQMEQAMQSGASATSVLGTAFRSLFSPLTFITILLTALAAVGLQMVDWPGLAASALAGLASALQTIAPYAMAAAAALALLYAPAIIGGVVSLIALLGRLAVSAVIAAGAMTAANPALALVVGITAAVAAANIFRDELAQIFGRDIVADAKNAVNFIIGAFVGGFNAIKSTWAALPAAIGDLVISTANTVIGGVESMVNKVAGLIDAFIGKINSAMQSLPFGIGDTVSIGSIGKFSLPRVANPNAGAAASANAAAQGAFNSAMGTDYVGALIEGTTKAASAASSKLKELAGSFTGAGDAAAGAGGKAKGAADGAKDAWEGLRKVTDDVAAKMKAAAGDLGQSFGGIFKGLLDKTTSWKDAALSALNSVLKYLNQMNVAGGGSGIFGGGLFQGLIGGLLGMSFADGAAFNAGNVVPFAKGGVVNKPTLFPMAKGAGLMGEAGPEGILPLKRGPNGSLGVVSYGGNQNAQPLRIELVSRFDADGGFEQAVERSSRPVAIVESAKAAGRVARAVPSMVDNRSNERQYRRLRPAGGLG